jgi:hypothetical protein
MSVEDSPILESSLDDFDGFDTTTVDFVDDDEGWGVLGDPADDGEWDEMDETEDGWGGMNTLSLDDHTGMTFDDKAKELVERHVVEVQITKNYVAGDPIYQGNNVILVTGFLVSTLELSREQQLARGMDCGIFNITLVVYGNYPNYDKLEVSAVHCNDEPFKLSWPIKNRVQRWVKSCFQEKKKNPLLCILGKIKDFILNAHKKCLICDSDMKVIGFKPSICDKDLCGYSYETFGVGVDLKGEIMSQPELWDLQIAFLITANVAKRLLFVELKIEDRVVNGSEMATILQQYCPSIAEMKEMISAGKHLARELNKRHKDLYAILRWLVTSNKSYIRLLEPHERIHDMKTEYQFIMVSDSPEKEIRFQQLKTGTNYVGKALYEKLMGKSSGSFFAFHGSSTCNWFSIMRAGLKNLSNTKHMTTGAAWGAGIYLAANASTSASYCSGRRLNWDKSAFGKSVQCLALCEVAGKDQPKSGSSGIYVIPEDDRVITRYLFVYPQGQHIPGARACSLKI